MWDKEIMPKVIGKTKIILCTQCKLVQRYDDVMETTHCTAEKASKGWQKCKSKEFWEI